ncbi:hypothetical protein LTR86_009647 [Recurvomyces mirabilis]|nr:hypothetical protein LTR86_009647 [Recurvomyces mirabilis]
MEYQWCLHDDHIITHDIFCTSVVKEFTTTRHLFAVLRRHEKLTDIRRGSWNGPLQFRSPDEQNVSTPPQVEVWRIGNGTDVRTTVMLGNVPNRMSFLARVLATAGGTPVSAAAAATATLPVVVAGSGKGEYDFLYLRIDFEKNTDVRWYALIDFANPEDILDFLTGSLVGDFCQARSRPAPAREGWAGELDNLMGVQTALMEVLKDEVYLNLVLEYVPETVYRALRHFNKLGPATGTSGPATGTSGPPDWLLTLVIMIVISRVEGRSGGLGVSVADALLGVWQCLYDS